MQGQPMSQDFSGPVSRSNKKRIKENRYRHPLLIAKTFFERLERSSGKDYSWIRPLTQPVSELMKYVRPTFGYVSDESMVDLLFSLLVDKM